MILSLIFRERSASPGDCYMRRAGQIGAWITIRGRIALLINACNDRSMQLNFSSAADYAQMAFRSHRLRGGRWRR
jgi:hypothetical protein